LKPPQSSSKFFHQIADVDFAMTAELPKYRALERLTIRIRDRRPREVYPGEEISFEGKPGAALLPLNAPARQNKLRAIVAGPGPHWPVDPVRMAKSLGFEGHDPAKAKAFIQDFVARETARQTASS
jgi:hypothetical protein